MWFFVKALLWGLLGLLVLVLIVLLIPVRVTVEVRYDTLKVKLKVLFIGIPLYPRNKKEEEEKTKTEKTVSESDGAQPPKRRRTLPQIADLVSTIGWAMRLILRLVHVRDIRLIWPVHCEDAAETALAYGQTQAYFGGALAAFQNVVNLRVKQWDVIPDFAGEYKYRRYFYCKITATPLIMIIAAVYAFAHLKNGRVI